MIYKNKTCITKSVYVQYAFAMIECKLKIVIIYYVRMNKLKAVISYEIKTMYYKCTFHLYKLY